MEIGQIIKKRREELGISQDELAQKVGYKSRSSINKIEVDGRGLPQSKIVAIAKALHTTPAYLMGWEDVPEAESSTGIVDMEAELRAVLSKIESADTIKFGDTEMNDTAKAMLKNSLEGLIQNLELIVSK